MSRSRFAPLLGLARACCVPLVVAGTVAIMALTNGSLPLRSSTLAFNRAANINAGGEVGGDDYVGVGGHSLALRSTAVADSTRGTTNPPRERARGAPLSTISVRRSLIPYAPDPGALDGTDIEHLIDVDPLLPPLAFGAGWTRTHALGLGGRT